MKRRYKLLIILVISFLLVIICYILFYRYQKSIVSIGYEFPGYNYIDYIKDHAFDKYPKVYKYNEQNILLHSFLDSIKKNKDNIEYYLKNASVIVINLGTDELNNYKEIDNTIVLDYLNTAYELLFFIKSLNNHKIVLINLYGDEYEFVNKKLKEYAKSFEICYIGHENISDKKLITLSGNVTLTYGQHLIIANQILKSNCQK